MKKLSIFLLGALGMIAAACDEAPEVAKPQVNPQEPLVTTGDVVTQPAGALLTPEGSELKLQDYKAEDKPVPIMMVTETKNLPAGATVSFKLEISDSESFARMQSMDALEGDEGMYYVAVDEWGKAHQALFGKSPKPKTTYYRVPVYVTFDGSDYRYESTDYYAAQGKMEVCGVDAGFVIYDNYYLLSNATTWDLGEAKKFPFHHNNPDVSVYDDPNFTINFEVTPEVAASGDYWKIGYDEAIDAQNWDGMIGTQENGDEALSGFLVSVNAQSGLIKTPGKYEMRINMESMEYEIELLKQPNHLYTPGGANGWNQEASGWMQLKEDKGLYYGVFPVSDGFKICEANDWSDATTWGETKPAAGGLTGTLSLGGAGDNINAPEAGTYWVMANFDPESYALTTYELVPITRIGVIGSFSASGWGSDIAMTTADNGATYTVDVELEAGTAWKIRFNDDWDYDLGGDISHMTWGGSDIQVEAVGTYTITLSLLGGYPRCTITKK